MKNSIQHASKAVLPKKKKKMKNEWMTDEILQLMEKRKYSNNDDEYKATDKTIKQKCKEAKEKWYNDRCLEIEELEKNHNMRAMHQKVKELTDRKNEIKSGSSCIKDKNGDMLFEKDQVAERWVEYISELYADDNRPEKEIITEIEGPEILQSEVENAIKKLKSGKAPGIDEIRGEELKALDSTGIQIITELCNEIYNNGYVPRDLRHSLYIKIPKKSKTTECTEHRTISLMSHAIKVILQIIIQRNSNKIEREIGKTQSGFRPKKGTREGIFNLRMIFDKYTELDKNIYICFIDYEKVFDRVYHHKLKDTLKRINIDGKGMRVIQALYYDQVAAVRIEDGHSEEFKIKRGVRQGCILSPKLFNLYTENVFREIDNLDGVKIGGININNLRYADDTALLAESEEQLQMK